MPNLHASLTGLWKSLSPRPIRWTQPNKFPRHSRKILPQMDTKIQTKKGKKNENKEENDE